MPNITSIVEIIQLMLAPGIMISACGLLLLGMNNKYSLVVNRIRLLNEERRRVVRKTSEVKDFDYQETQRLESISMQISSLVFRVKLVRNAVLAYTTCCSFICYYFSTDRIWLSFRNYQAEFIYNYFVFARNDFCLLWSCFCSI